MCKYQITLYWSDEDRTFVAEVPELPGCMAHGATQEAALRHAKEAISLWTGTDLEAEEQRTSATDRLSQGTPTSWTFWESPTLEELARAQNVKPMADVQPMFGTWPGQENDGFEAAIDELRRPGTKAGKQP